MTAHSFLAVLAHRHHAKGDPQPTRGDPTPHHTTPDPAHETIGTTRAEADPPLRRRIRLTLAEIRRLFNLRDQAQHVIHAAMNWSTYRVSTRPTPELITSDDASRSNT